MIILDFGSGNTIGQDLNYGKRMIDELSRIDSHRHQVVIKWQLFEICGQNIPLNRGLFGRLYEYAYSRGYDTTASVFDKISLDFLLRFDIPFVKIANRPDLYFLADRIPEGREVRVIKSVGDSESFKPGDLCCVSEYPADPKQYEKAFKKGQLKQGISDHTEGLDLYKKYQPEFWEKHFCLEDSEGPDSGPFAIRPNQLKETL